jgi:hypothetical protein
MGCGGSKPSAAEEPLARTPQAQPQYDEDDEIDESLALRRRSVAHQSPEIDGGSRKGTTFSTKQIGTLTRHGIAPTRGASGVTSKAKINQDRGLVCWPFNGSYDQALLCIFDGHGMQGERISQWCMDQIPGRLEESEARLANDTVGCLHDSVRRRPRAAPLLSAPPPPPACAPSLARAPPRARARAPAALTRAAAGSRAAADREDGPGPALALQPRPRRAWRRHHLQCALL